MEGAGDAAQASRLLNVAWEEAKGAVLELKSALSKASVARTANTSSSSSEQPCRLQRLAFGVAAAFLRSRSRPLLHGAPGRRQVSHAAATAAIRHRSARSSSVLRFAARAHSRR